MFPVSQIVINHELSANKSFHEIKFNKIEFLDLSNYDLRITGISVQLDTSALYNIKETNKFDVYQGGGSSPSIVYIDPGYYSQSEISRVSSNTIQFEAGYAVINSADKIDLKDAKDLLNILKTDVLFTKRSYEACDFSNNLNEFRIYSSIVKQHNRSENTCPLIDFFITVLIGLNNLETYENISISVNINEDFDKLWYIVKDRFDNDVTINTSIFLNYTISILPK